MLSTRIAAVYKKYNLVPGPENKNKMTMSQIKEEVQKLTNVRDRTGFLYFLLEYVRVKHMTKGGVWLRDDIYNWQIEAAVDFLSSTNIISKKTRQVGFSTIVGAYALWRCLFFESQNCCISSIGQRESTNFLRERVKFVYENLPDWLRQDTSEFAKTSIGFEHNNSRFTSLPNNDDPARGESLSLLIADEFAAYMSQNEYLASATPSLSTGMMAEFTNSSLPSQLFIISTLPKTPFNKKGEENKYLQLLHGAQSGENSYKLIDVKTDDIPYYQDSKWHKHMLDTLGPRLYSIEIKGEEVYDTENMYLPGYLYELLKSEDPIRCDFLRPEDVTADGLYHNMDVFPFLKDGVDLQYNYVQGLWFFEEPAEGKEYGITCDISTGRAGDYSTALIFDLQKNSLVAAFKGKIDTERFKTVIEKLLDIFPNAKLSIESTGLGAPVCEYFATTLNYEFFYWHRYSKKNYKPGFPMSPSMRAQVLAIGQSYLIKDIPEGLITLKDVRLITELKRFGYSNTGKMQALEGNDDFVLALLQYIYLKHIGWMFSEVHYLEGDDDDNDKEDENVFKQTTHKQLKKYWQQSGTILEEEEANSLIGVMESEGLCLPQDTNMW